MDACKSCVATPSTQGWAERILAIVCGLVLTWAAVYLCAAPLARNLASGRDLIAYWATGQALAHHANPYDAAWILSLERQQGYPAWLGVALMRNPPWSLPLAWPLGWLGIGWATAFWTLLQLACLTWTLRLLWTLLGRPRDPLFALAVCFVPALICLVMGQTTLFSALGLALFLRYHEERPLAAGMALWLCLLKPQLFVPFGVALLVWIAHRRRWVVLAGAAWAMAASLFLTAWIAPQAWAQYATMSRNVHMELDRVPCFSVLLRLALRPQAAWVQFALPVAASLWAIGFSWKNRMAWNWLRQGAPLMMASVLLAPYSWIYDQGLLVPGLLYAALRTRLRWVVAVLALANLGIMVPVMAKVPIASFAYLWTGPLWLAGYLLMMRFPRAGTDPDEAAGEVRMPARVQERAEPAGRASGSTGTISN